MSCAACQVGPSASYWFWFAAAAADDDDDDDAGPWTPLYNHCIIVCPRQSVLLVYDAPQSNVAHSFDHRPYGERHPNSVCRVHVCLFACNVCLFICCLSVCLSVCLPAFPLSFQMSVCLTACLPIRLPGGRIGQATESSVIHTLIAVIYLPIKAASFLAAR
jgi:hypothetical protein